MLEKLVKDCNQPLYFQRGCVHYSVAYTSMLSLEILPEVAVVSLSAWVFQTRRGPPSRMPNMLCLL